MFALVGTSAHANVVLYRVNAGGPQIAAIDGGLAWSQDLTGANASPYVNSAAIGDNLFGHSAPLVAPDPSVPAYVPLAVFEDERWDASSAPEMKWEFPVVSGTYRVNLMLMDGFSGTQFVGARRINVVAEGITELADYDIYAHFGGYRPGMASFNVNVTDGSLSLEFQHLVNDPAIRAIEIEAVTTPGKLGAAPAEVEFGTRLVGSLSPPQLVTISNLGGPGDPTLHITHLAISPGFLHNMSPQTLAPGETRTFQVRYAPADTFQSSGTLTVDYDGASSPLVVALHGTPVLQFPVTFGRAPLSGGGRVNPTAMQFGPDNRLYVAEHTGRIFAITVQKTSSEPFIAAATEEIDAIRAIPNHNDDGTLNASLLDRRVTGMVVAGNAASPVIYVTSSDPREGFAQDLGTDTNSGVLSRLDRVSGTWVRTDLVRGLPRSRADHGPNGMALDAATQTLYLAVAGNTNLGAPSAHYANLPEYALSGALLAIDLTAIGSTTYDLPTLDDENRAGVNDANDPFGGDGGRNQAILVPGGPVRVYATGFNDPWNVVFHSNNRLYTSDAGAIAGWGGPPLANGPGGVCTNTPNENNSRSDADQLHVISSPGLYAGHANPTRASQTNTFNSSNPQSPVPADDPAECSDLAPGVDGSIAQWGFAVRALAEYRASNFGSALKGRIVGAGTNNTIQLVTLDATGDSVVSVSTLFSNVDTSPAAITTQGDGVLFPGTIWTADYITGRIFVYEPLDGGVSSCTGANSASLDEDGDGYTNADEFVNFTDPCSALSRPADFDHDLLSDINDPDDDNDGILDVHDAFSRDASNGANTPMPVLYGFGAGDPGTGFFGDGFTGLMSNGVTDYRNQYSPDNVTADFALGRFRIDAVPAGDALGSRNSQQYAFQFGITEDSTAAPFRVHTRVLKPFFGATPADSMSEGVYLGDGTQDDYVKIVLAHVGGQFAIGVTSEIAGVPVETYVPTPLAASANAIDLLLDVDPATATVQASVQIDGGAPASVGPAIVLPANSATARAIRTSNPLAVGLVATSRGATPFPAVWDFLFVEPAATLDAPPVQQPVRTRLLPSAPHPVRRGTNLRFELATTTRTRLALYGIDGRLVRVLTDGWRSPGSYSLRWDGDDAQGRPVQPGVYFVRLDAGEARENGRLIVLE